MGSCYVGFVMVAIMSLIYAKLMAAGGFCYPRPPIFSLVTLFGVVDAFVEVHGNN